LAAVYLYEGYSFSHIWDREKLGQVWEQAGKLQMAKQAPEWYAHLAMIYAYNGDAEQGLAALTGALNHAPVDSWVAGYMHVNIGLILHDFNRRVASAEPMSRALAVLRPLGDAHLISTALQHHAIALYHAGELDKADGLLEQARQQAEASGSLWRLIHILDLVARRHVYTGRLQAGWAVLAERRRLHKVRGQKRLLAECVHWDSLYISRFGDLDEALRLRRQAQELARELDDGVRLAWNAFELGELERIRGHIPAAAQAYHEAGRRFQMMDHPLGLAYYQRALGELALAAGDVAVARKHFKQFLDSLDWEMDWNMRYAHLCLARAALAAGDWREVERWLQPLFETALVGEFRELALAGLAVLAAVRQQSGQPEESIELSAFVAAHTYTWQEYRRLARDVQRQASAQLEDATAADAQRRGQAARLEEMIRPFLAEEAYD
ncbi:MAG: hypothetical protein R3300_12270, partial [Candidatus Promineifilaceae bacterium]|nr:hypothetical protein [Candidatus Promineifilaceae bacterium]